MLAPVAAVGAPLLAPATAAPTTSGMPSTTGMPSATLAAVPEELVPIGGARGARPDRRAREQQQHQDSHALLQRHDAKQARKEGERADDAEGLRSIKKGYGNRG